MKIRTTIAVLGLTGLMSCSKENENNDIIYSSWPVVKVEGATAGTLNQVIPITISWPYSSGCDVVDKFAESKTGNSIIITTLGHTVKAYCTMDAGIKTITYNFKATQPGVYELKFVNNDSFIPHVVTIN